MQPDWSPDDLPPTDRYEVIERLIRLRDLLAEAPHDSASIFHQLADFYPNNPNGQRKLRRDLHNLQALGYQIEPLPHYPRRWTLRASPQRLSDDDVTALTYVRAAFSPAHPLAAAVHRLLHTLTRHLTTAQQHIWQRPSAVRLAFEPVTDYHAYADLLQWLENAILQCRQIGFFYRSRSSTDPTWHPRLDPYEIEFADRQFYLVAFSYRFNAVLTFRINRIVQDQTHPSPVLLNDVQQLRRERKPIVFTYRLPRSFADGGVSERFTIHAVQTDEQYVTIQASDTSEFRIVKVLLGYGAHALLLDGPPTLLERMRQTVARMAAQYGVNGESLP